ncbi:hypothetical protein BJY24_006375 [Nocardia transvalensis]|uniref:Uncharacterized protein n=1 Tax=Nocardia transvalensis TaxID=37333 RepID=A0A7W9ULE1_9NOCA|nr:hypothetical protein [Nocardia transvalensis]MBB5917463.1 hypothetical protein [Nocardia transvalensis]
MIARVAVGSPAGWGELLEEIRRLSSCEHAALDAATGLLSEGERAYLADRLTQVAVHIATRAGVGRGLPPPGTLPGAGTDRIDLSVQCTAILVAGMFLRNTLFRWGWMDVLTDAGRAVHDLTTAFVAAMEDSPVRYPTRMTVRLRAVSAARLVVEVQDSPENAGVIAEAGRLISADIERNSVRCGQHTIGGRTVVWAELSRPEPSTRWI